MSDIPQDPPTEQLSFHELLNTNAEELMEALKNIELPSFDAEELMKNFKLSTAAPEPPKFTPLAKAYFWIDDVQEFSLKYRKASNAEKVQLILEFHDKRPYTYKVMEYTGRAAQLAVLYGGYRLARKMWRR